MHDMRQLAELVRELDEQLKVCMRCGLCQSVCPLFAETGREADVARGKIALLDGLIREMFRSPGGVDRRLSRCLLCGSCAAGCPSGVKAMDIFLRARALLTGYMGLNPLKKIIFRGLLSRPRIFDTVARWGIGLQDVFLKPANRLPATSRGRSSFPLGERHLVRLAPKPFHREFGFVDKPGTSGVKAAFFVGCLTDKIYPEIGRAVLRSLEHDGAGIFLPDGQGCCGIPALSSGDVESFQKLVLHNLDRFSTGSFDYLVTACATCTATIKKVWPLFAAGFNGRDQARIAALSEKTMDISQFMVDTMRVVADNSTKAAGTRILTYHDPCHLGKSLGVAAQPRKLISAHPAYSFKEMPEADRCCGFGGTFNLEHYDISSAIGKRKRDSIVSSGCETVATSCPACMLHLSDMLSRSSDKIHVKHAIEIYADSLSGEYETPKLS